MATFTFHNKYHRNVHHTIPTSGYPDSASDPIASKEYPFLGIFYNVLQSGLSGNSFDWSNTYTAVTANSSIWERFFAVYTSVNSNSAFWENNISLYNTYNELSSNWNSAYTTVSVNSAFWNRFYLDETLHDDRVQQDTRQKNFKILQIQPDDTSNIYLDLSAGQVSYYATSETSNVSGFFGAKRGGKYYLYVITNGTCNSAIKLNFDPDFFKFNSSNSYPITGSWLRKFEFISDGTHLHGKSVLFDTNTIEEENTYFKGRGIIIDPNPIYFSTGDNFNPVRGISVQGVYPYEAGKGLKISRTPYSGNFFFVFTTSNAQSAIEPYGTNGSEDRMILTTPTLTATDATTKDNVISFLRCAYHESVDITTRAYGYISELIFNDVLVKDFIFPPQGYSNHETGHSIRSEVFPITGDQTLFVRFGNPIPLELSGGISLWLDAMDYSSVNFNPTNNFIVGLSSKISNTVSFSSVSASEIFYNLSPKQSFNYNLSSTHYTDLLISGSGDFVSLTVLTPVASSSEIEWIWSNGDYGIFKLPNSFSLGVGNLSTYYTYPYDRSNVNNPIAIGTLYLSSGQTQSTWINGSLTNTGLPLTADFTGGYTMIGGLNPLTGFANFKLHENVLYSGSKTLTQMNDLNEYLVDKWKFL
jgi:hypothetical protein